MTTVVTVSPGFDDISGVSNVTSGYRNTLPQRFDRRHHSGHTRPNFRRIAIRSTVFPVPPAVCEPPERLVRLQASARSLLRLRKSIACSSPQTICESNKPRLCSGCVRIRFGHGRPGKGSRVQAPDQSVPTLSKTRSGEDSQAAGTFGLGGRRTALAEMFEV